MPAVSIFVGLILVFLGLGAYFGTGQQSVTALIPTFFGIPMAGLGMLARDPSRLAKTLHIASVLALLGLVGSARGIPATLALMAGRETARPEAAVVQTIMAVLCLVFLVLAVRSFVIARRARAAT